MVADGCSGAAPSDASGRIIEVPSGQPVEMAEIVTETRGGQRHLVLRYLAPRISDGMDYSTAEADLDHLCATDGVRHAVEAGDVSQIVVTLMDRFVERGMTDTEATQFFSAYRFVDGACVWLEF